MLLNQRSGKALLALNINPNDVFMAFNIALLQDDLQLCYALRWVLEVHAFVAQLVQVRQVLVQELAELVGWHCLAWMLMRRQQRPLLAVIFSGWTWAGG